MTRSGRPKMNGQEWYIYVLQRDSQNAILLPRIERVRQDPKSWTYRKFSFSTFVPACEYSSRHYPGSNGYTLQWCRSHDIIRLSKTASSPIPQTRVCAQQFSQLMQSHFALQRTGIERILARHDWRPAIATNRGLV